MSIVNLCLIIAAGKGSRLSPSYGGTPKPLVKFQGIPLLEHVIRNAHTAGIDRFVIVLGYKADAIREWFADSSVGDVAVTWVDNRDYNKKNGVSVLKAKNVIHEPFLLLMADHVFKPETARALLSEPLRQDEVILAVDHNIEQIFDLDDATKVLRDGDHIVDIGKEIPRYDALDTGMFLCSPALFANLDASVTNGNCSLSDGMRRLCRTRGLRAFDIGDASWQDLDTPEAVAYADGIFDWGVCYEDVRGGMNNV